MIPFPPSFFLHTVQLVPQVAVVSPGTGGTHWADGTPITMPASVQPAGGNRRTADDAVEADRRWLLYTATDPGFKVGDVVRWLTSPPATTPYRSLRVVVPAVDETLGEGLLYTVQVELIS